MWRAAQVAAVPLALALAACTPRAPDKVAVDAQRQILSEGYSMLYADATTVDRARLILYVKAESREFDDVITAVSEYGGELKAELERVARDYPGVRIDLTPLPEMERRKRFAVATDRAVDFRPLGGRSRTEYERTLLIGISNALNHESHLCRVMAQEEPDAGLKKVLLAAEARYQGLYKRIIDLLNREHFRHDPG